MKEFGVPYRWFFCLIWRPLFLPDLVPFFFSCFFFFSFFFACLMSCPYGYLFCLGPSFSFSFLFFFFTTSSGSVSGPELPHSLICSHVPAGPARNVTGKVMPTALAEAVTQLSFLEFLQRCHLLIAPPQPPQLPVPISPLDAAVQTTSPSDASGCVHADVCSAGLLVIS